MVVTGWLMAVDFPLLKGEKTPCQNITLGGVEVSVLRADLNHPIIQGNKLWKLKYNLEQARRTACDGLITFGGAYSNHLLATAQAAQLVGMRATGVVRGDELANHPEKWSSTLKQCRNLGMRLVFVSRSDYRLKVQARPVQGLLSAGGKHWIIPEGGSNQFAIKGVAEWVQETAQSMPSPSHLLCPVGTGGTLAGLIVGVSQSAWRCQVLGVGVLKGLHGVKHDINQWLTAHEVACEWSVLTQYHAGGYHKSTPELVGFCQDFKQQHDIQLDKIYNAKSFFALADMIASGAITPQDTPLIIHTGGLQGGVF